MKYEIIIRLTIFLAIFTAVALFELRSLCRKLTTSKKFRWINNLAITIGHLLEIASYNMLFGVSTFTIPFREFAECVQEELKDDLKYLKFFPGDKFREAMFPWFEPNTAPKDIEELSALLSKTLVQKRIESLGVELLIYVHGYTKTNDEQFGGYPYIGGLYSAERETHIWTTVWDLKEIVHVGDTDISFKGTVHWGIVGIVPFAVLAFTESNACNETAKRISNSLTGKDSSTDK